MSRPEALYYDARSVRLRHRLAAHAAIGVGRLLATQSPRRIRKLLGWLQRGTAPATVTEAQTARDAVVKVSPACAGPEGCLARSLGTVLLCRLHGKRVTWCVGARRIPPFGAHAWIEAEGQPVGEPYPPDYFRTFFSVP